MTRGVPGGHLSSILATLGSPSHTPLHRPTVSRLGLLHLQQEAIFCLQGVLAASCKPSAHLQWHLGASTGRRGGKTARLSRGVRQHATCLLARPRQSRPFKRMCTSTLLQPRGLQAYMCPVRTPLNKRPSPPGRQRALPGQCSPTRSDGRVCYQTQRGEARTARAGRLTRAKSRQGRCVQRGPGWRPLHAHGAGLSGLPDAGRPAPAAFQRSSPGPGAPHLRGPSAAPGPP